MKKESLEHAHEGSPNSAITAASRFSRCGRCRAPEPGPGQVLVAVRAAGINISEAKIRSGAVGAIFPATFPGGQGSDLAGVTVRAVAPTAGEAVVIAGAGGGSSSSGSPESGEDVSPSRR